MCVHKLWVLLGFPNPTVPKNDQGAARKFLTKYLSRKFSYIFSSYILESHINLLIVQKHVQVKIVSGFPIEAGTRRFSPSMAYTIAGYISKLQTKIFPPYRRNVKGIVSCFSNINFTQ
jgi:hypothetical protein